MNSETDSMQKTYNRFKADNIPVLRRGGDTNSHKLVTTDFFSRKGDIFPNGLSLGISTPL